jgi:hypothetical protein
MTPEAGTAGALVSDLCAWIDRLFPDADRGERLKRALAYHLQSQRRGRLVGQRTAGAADHITPVRLSRHVRALLPEARVRDAVTGTNWEGTGVVPDIPSVPAEVLKAAIEAMTPG